MKLIRFDAIALHGYLDISINFDASLTILIGSNGVGKTSALKLIQALLGPSLPELLRTKFDTAQLIFDDASRQRVVMARKRRDELTIKVSDVDGELVVSRLLLDEVEAGLPAHRRELDSTRAMRLRFFENPVFKALQSVGSPLFLGLDRRSVVGEDEDAIDSRPRNSAAHAMTRARHANSSLDEVQLLVADAFRRARRLRDQQLEGLKKRVLLSSLQLEPIDHLFEGDQVRIDALFNLQRQVPEKRRDWEEAFVQLGIDRREVRDRLDSLYSGIDELLPREGEHFDFKGFVQSIVNHNALSRIAGLVAEFNSFDGKAPLEAKFRSFVSVVNSFFVDSRKELSIDAVGALTVRLPTKEETGPASLSSGEQQLLILFGHLFFNSFGARSSVFVIDEPEVSLHLKWQSKLLGQMMKSNDRAQVVIATHAPEIVAHYVDNVVRMPYGD